MRSGYGPICVNPFLHWAVLDHLLGDLDLLHNQLEHVEMVYLSANDADVGMFHCAPDLEGFYPRCGWIPMKDAVTHIGSREHPVLAQERMMMQFFTEKGRRAACRLSVCRFTSTKTAPGKKTGFKPASALV